jgi:hypothetical protein
MGWGCWPHSTLSPSPIHGILNLWIYNTITYFNYQYFSNFHYLQLSLQNHLLLLADCICLLLLAQTFRLWVQFNLKGEKEVGEIHSAILVQALGPNMFLCISCLSADHECPFAFVRPNGPWILQQRHESGPWIDGQFNHQNHLGPLQGVITSSQIFAHPPQIHTCLFHSFWVA